jgi:hypothetical protein
MSCAQGGVQSRRRCAGPQVDGRRRELIVAGAGDAVERVRQSTESEAMECSGRFPVSSGG